MNIPDFIFWRSPKTAYRNFGCSGGGRNKVANTLSMAGLICRTGAKGR